MMMRLFDPSELQSKHYHELTVGDCFFDETTSTWSVVFELLVADQQAVKFVVPLSGNMRLIASRTPDPMLTESTRVTAFGLKDTFSIKLETDPIAMSGEAIRSTNNPLVLLEDGPAILAGRQDASYQKPLPGFLLNLRTFACVAIQARQVEMHRPIVVERWSLIFKDELNRGTMFFQHQPAPQPALA